MGWLFNLLHTHSTQSTYSVHISAALFSNVCFMSPGTYVYLSHVTPCVSLKFTLYASNFLCSKTILSKTRSRYSGSLFTAQQGMFQGTFHLFVSNRKLTFVFVSSAGGQKENSYGQKREARVRRQKHAADIDIISEKQNVRPVDQ